MFSISVSKIVGTAREKHWSQVHSFRPADEKFLAFGELFLVFGLDATGFNKDKDLDLAAIGKEFIQRFHEQYYGLEERPESPHKHLLATVEKVVHEFEAVFFELVAGVMLPVELPGKLGVLYLAAAGSASAVMRRNNQLYRLLKSRKDSAARPILHSVSGFIAEGDMLLCGTEDFFKLVSFETLQKTLAVSDPVEASSILAPHVHESENSGVAALIGLIEGSEESSISTDDAERGEQSVESGAVTKGLQAGSVEYFSKMLGFWRKIKAAASRRKGTFVTGSAVDVQDIVVREGKDKQRKLMYSIALVLLVLLGVSVTFGWRRRVNQERERRFAEVWEVVEHQYSEAISLADLNPLRARALLTEAKKLVEEALFDSPKELSQQQREQLAERLEEISKILEEVSGEHKIEEANVFLDLTLVRPDSYGEVLALHEDTVVVLDRTAAVLLRMSVGKKSSEAVGGGTLLHGAKLASVYADRGFVTSNSGVVEVSLENKTSAVVVEDDSEWGEIVDVEAFAGNLYLLDRVNGEIFRYQSAEGGFGQRQRWLGEGVFPDFSKVVSMAIDGDIWVLTSDNVLRFRRGAPEPLTLGGLDIALSEPVALYTDEESEKIYILDRGNKRVLVLDKSGEYSAQYLWEGIEGVSDMVVSEKEGKILLLSGSIIYEIEISD